MSDIEYLAIKESEGKTVRAKGTAFGAGSGTFVTLTAGGGKDLYLSSASVTVRPTSTYVIGQVSLKANGVAIETIVFSVDSDGGTGKKFPFDLAGIKVPAGQALTITSDTASAQIDISGTINGFEENTGASPTI